MTPLAVLVIAFVGAILGVSVFKVVGIIKEKISDKAQKIKIKKDYEHRALHSKEILKQEIEQITKPEPIAQEKQDENIIQRNIEKYL